MSELAERVYETQSRSKTESAVEETRRLIVERDNITREIKNANDYTAVFDIYKRINVLKNDGLEEVSVELLKTDLSERIALLKDQENKTAEELLEQENTINAEVYSGDAEEIQRINANADQIALRLLLRLSNDRTQNLRIIGDALKTNDRATGVALMKIAQSASYKSLFSPRMKDQMIAMSRTPAEVKWQEGRKMRLSEVGKKRSKAVMENFRLEQLEKMISSKSQYFK